MAARIVAQKVHTTSRKPAVRESAPRHLGLSQPRYVWQARRQPAAFGRGVDYAKQLLGWIEAGEHKGTASDCASMVQAGLLTAIRKAPASFAAGVSATLAAWLTEARDAENDARAWTPIAMMPEILVRGGREFPPADHKFFDIVGMAVSVGQAHNAYRWNSDRAMPIDVRAVTEGMIARPISRREFDLLRKRKEA